MPSKLARYIPLLIISLLTIFISFNFFNLTGMYTTHDGDFHLVRSLHFLSELKHGQFPVRVAPDLAFSHGYLAFQFFYPLPYYVVAIFQLLGISTTLSWKIMQILITFASLSVFYIWTRKSFDTKSALTATAIYALVPFRFLTLYVTGQIGGYFGLFFASVVFLGIHNTLRSKSKFTGPLLALGIAGLITSHLLSIILFFLPLVGYTLILLKEKFAIEKFKSLARWSLVGVGLSSFYLFPFLFEKQWVKIGNQVLVEYTDHWPTLKQLIYSPWGYGSSVNTVLDGMSFQIGLALIASLSISLLLTLIKKKKMTVATYFIFCLLVMVFLMLEFSAPVWKLLTPLQLIQYPWRLLAVTTLLGSWLTAWLIHNLKGRAQWLAIVLLLVVAVYNVRNYTKPWPLGWKTDFDYTANTSLFYGSTDISWELMPITTTGAPNKKPESLILIDESQVTISHFAKTNSGATRYTADISAKGNSQLNILIWDLPIWEVRVNGIVQEKQRAEDGTILVPITESSKSLEIILKKTNLQIISDLLSLICLLYIAKTLLFQKQLRT
ncbi:hypothetical protein KA017_01130 [Candidatus Woesebacteria bacterium]|nr:hypothetical protein [Candidatus Woesebacteria bacterium]